MGIYEKTAIHLPAVGNGQRLVNRKYPGGEENDDHQFLQAVYKFGMTHRGRILCRQGGISILSDSTDKKETQNVGQY